MIEANYLAIVVVAMAVLVVSAQLAESYAGSAVSARATLRTAS